MRPRWSTERDIRVSGEEMMPKFCLASEVVTLDQTGSAGLRLLDF